MSKCTACNKEIGQEDGAPWMEFKNLELCSSCYIGMILPIFKMRGMGDGGIIDIAFQECVGSDFDLKRKKKRLPMSALESSDQLAEIIK